MTLKIQENIPLASLTTFEIGGKARFFAEATEESELAEALAWARKQNLRSIILAGGSNVLIPDKGVDALVIRIVGETYTFEGQALAAHAGCNLLALIHAAGEKGLGGWEKLAGIPGTVGGAVRGNAGAFGPEIKDFVGHVRALNTETGEARRFENVECEFSYRDSFFKRNPAWVITRVHLVLQDIEPSLSKKTAGETIAEREKRHIQNVRAAGSYFMNPIVPPAVREMFEKEKKTISRGGRVPAGWLIEKAGMKGARVGGAVASEQHPNYIKNDGTASAADVLALARKIKDAIHSQFRIELKEEAAILTP